MGPRNLLMSIMVRCGVLMVCFGLILWAKSGNFAMFAQESPEIQQQQRSPEIQQQQRTPEIHQQQRSPEIQQQQYSQSFQQQPNSQDDQQQLPQENHNQPSQDQQQEPQTQDTQPQQSEQFHQQQTPSEHRPEQLGFTGESMNKTEEDKLILFWTTFYHQDPKVAYISEGTKHFERCPNTQCTMSNDKSLLDKASMVLFHHRDPPNFPTVRYPHQLYVHFTMDPPQSNSSYLDEYANQLNMTANYRADADIANPYSFYAQSGEVRSGHYEPVIPFRNKTKSIAWIVSHCDTESKREQYVEELKKYIDVDIYGKCGNYSCSSEHGYSNCMKILEQSYKFYLSFENNVCPFYHTEKLTNALDVELIPLVLGMSNYNDTSISPPHSTIDVRDFDSPKHLAEYLKFLGNNEQEYYKYFEWKSLGYKRVHGSVWCRFCDVLHSEKYQIGDQFVPSYKTLGGYQEWWQGQCDNDLVSRMRLQQGWH